MDELEGLHAVAMELIVMEGAEGDDVVVPWFQPGSCIGCGTDMVGLDGRPVTSCHAAGLTAYPG